MYGLVNQAIEEFVLKNFDEATWENIKQKANYLQPGFISMESYDDAVTYNLVGAASEILNYYINS